MKNFLFSLLFLAVYLLANNGLAANHRLGGGGNYWVSIDDIEVKDIEKNGLSLLVSYQYWNSLFALEFDAEFMPNRFGNSSIAPQSYVLVGRAIYAGLGIGTTYTDGKFATEPFFAIKAGLNLELLPGIYADIFGNYRFNDRADLENSRKDIDTDTVFLGAIVRIDL